MIINNLERFRYSITGLPNGKNIVPAGLGMFAIVMATTYIQLIEHHKKQLLVSSNSSSIKQVTGNHLTAIRGFMRTNNKTDVSPVGHELTTDFDLAVREHLENSGLGYRSQADRKSLLNLWRATFKTMGAEVEPKKGRERRDASDVPLDQNQFEKTLCAALKAAKMAPKRAAKLAGVSTSALSRWTRGALPNARSKESMNKLDVVLDLCDGTLYKSFLVANGGRGGNQEGTSIEYRIRLRELTQSRYTLKDADVTPGLLEEWRIFFSFKTDTVSTKLKRNKKHRWNLSEASNCTTPVSRFTKKGTQVSATASFVWDKVAAFIGFLQLPLKDGGYGLNKEDTQTMAWFVVPDAIDAFLLFKTNRSAGLKHAGHKAFCTLVTSLVNTEYGYLAQCPHLIERLPENVTRGFSWSDLCLAAKETAEAWKADSHDISREPELPIQQFLELKEPLKPFFGAMQKLRHIANTAFKGSAQEATARRDELLLGFLVSNPLRDKNIKTLTYKSNNSGDVYQTPAGQWRIKLVGSKQKARKRLGGKPYNVPVAAWLQDLMTAYVREFRPILAKGMSANYFFLSQNGTRFNSLNQQVFKRTRTLISGCDGINPHAFRHLVATDWLTKFPNDFLTVAELLNDTIEVVMSSYAHLKKEVAFNRYEAYVQKQLPASMS